jgi:hypothetical protein
MKNEKEMLTMDKLVDGICPAYLEEYLDSEHIKMVIEIDEKFSQMYSPSTIKAKGVVEHMHKKHLGEQSA